MTQYIRHARRLFAVVVGVAAVAALTGPLAGSADATGNRIVLATGPLVKGSTTYPDAVVTYDPTMDATDQGSNPGLEVWPSVAAEAAGTGRLSRSNDNNGQWDYDPAGAFFANNTVVVYGTRTGSGNVQGRSWTYGGGSFLLQESVVVDCGEPGPAGRTVFGPFNARVGNTAYPNLTVSYDQALDDGDAGSTPGLEVYSDATLTQRVLRAGDNNGQWDYRIDCAYGVRDKVYIVGARSSNGGASFTPRVWSIPAGGGFLAQSSGF